MLPSEDMLKHVPSGESCFRTTSHAHRRPGAGRAAECFVAAVDMTARINVFDTEISSRSRGWFVKSPRMISPVRLFLLGSIVLAGCTTARNVAVSTFRVVDTPARFVRDRIDPPETTTTTTRTVETTSDVANPGRPVAAPTPPQRSVTRGQSSTPTTRVSPRPQRPDQASTARSSPSVSPAARSTAASPQFPTARPVPGRAGYVYSIDPKGGIVDVTGYKPGDKAKDPYTQQIFIVP